MAAKMENHRPMNRLPPNKQKLLWNDFETNLANIDEDVIIENALSNSGSDYEASKQIIDEAHRNGSKDDKTIIIVRR